MARTTFSGPVKSDNGFEGSITGNITGNVTGNVTGDVAGNVTGYVIFPTTDPMVVGAWWNDNGVLTISAAV